MKNQWIIPVLMLIVVALPLEALAKSDLLTAYRKEYAFLEAEKQALRRRLEEIDADNAGKVRSAAGEIHSLQNRVLALRAQSDDVELSLRDVETKTVRAQEKADLVLETLSRAADTLGRSGVEITAEVEGLEAQAEQIAKAFEGSAEVIRKGGLVRTEEGSFFLEDGSLVDGKLVRVGQIATFGVSAKGSGALAPAGGNRLKMWPMDASESATILAAGGKPAALSLYLYESLSKAVEEKKTQTVVEHIASGGIIAWVIAVLGGLSLLLVIARVVILMLASSKTEKLLTEVSEALVKGQRREAMRLCQAGAGAAARVLRATLRNLDREREHLEDIVSEAILHEAPVIERFGSSIMVLAAVAPLLGLLGTVTGMISTFDIITEFGTGDPKMLSGGISEALVTTKLGLIVAIPALLFGNMLSGRASTILQSMERAALKVMNLADDPTIRETLAQVDAEQSPSPDQQIATAAPRAV